MQAGGLDCVTGLAKYQGRLIILLDISKVLAAPELGNAPSAEPPAAAASAKAGTGTGTGKKTASAGK
jgi:chemotaxis signal transduction protein